MAMEKTRSEQLLLQTQIEVQEETRKNLAIELHDNIGQLLSLTNVTTASINLDDKERSREKIADIQSLLSRSIKELRQLSRIIHGEQLIEEGIIPAIERDIQWLKRNEYYRVNFEHSLLPLSFNDPGKDLFIYRLFQESLNNIIRHSGADKIDIRLDHSANIMTLTIQDNGKGFLPPEETQTQKGLGLRNMKNRVTLLDGTMTIDSILQTGTTVIFTIPYLLK